MRSFKIFITLFSVYAFLTTLYLTTNEFPRFSLASAIVEERSFAIDTLHNRFPYVISGERNGIISYSIWHNVDYAVYNGHYYSDKAPIGSFLAVPIYFLVRLFTSDIGVLAYFCSLFVSGLLTCFTAVLIYRFGRYYTRDENLRTMVSFSYGLGTLALSYATLFFSHNITAFFVFASFYVLYSVKRGEKKDKHLFIAGLLAGIAPLSDYYALFVSLIFLVYCFSFSRLGSVKFLMGFIIALSILPFYNYMLFDNPFAFPQNFHGTFKEAHEKGFYGFTGIHCDALIALTFSPFKGIFFYDIVLLLSLFLFFRFYRIYPLEGLLLAMVFFIAFISNAMYYAWDGGICVGPRHLVFILPFMVIPLFSIKDSKKEHRLFFLFFFISFFMNFLYASSHLNIGYLGEGVFKAGFPVIPEASNIFNQLLLRLGVLLSFSVNFLVFVFLFILWSKEITEFIEFRIMDVLWVHGKN
jgi:4-amino-4-deoxy-L-arabinose transferase-like glycosyltransferase